MIICSPQLGLSQESILGGEVFDREILTRLARSGIKVEIILPKGLKHDKNIKNLNFTYIPFAHFPAALFNLLVIPYLFKLHNKNQLDIIRLHQPQFVGLGALIFKIFHPKVRLVATYHQFSESNFKILSRIINNWWDHIICDSFEVKRKLIEKYKVSQDKISVVHNGAPSYLSPGSRDKRLEKKLKLENKHLLLYMGLFVQRKNPLFLLQVLKSLKKTAPNVTLAYWGKGPLKKDIEKTANELGVSKIIMFIRPAFGIQKRKYHNLADIFVHPAIDEGFALAPLEAMACAKPVIMNNSHSAKEAIENGVNGYICNTNDVKSWTDAILKLLEDKSKLKNFGQNANRKVKSEFNWDISAKTHIEVFKKLVSC